MAVNFAAWGNDLYTGRRSYKVVQRRSRYFWVSGVLSVLAVLVLVLQGFNLGIDFKGGTEIIVSNTTTQSQDVAVDAVHQVVPDDEVLVSSVGSDSVRVQTTELTSDQLKQVTAALQKGYGVSASDISGTSVGPTWGQDVSQKAVQGLVVFLVLVAAFMAIYFRNWRMALAALVALLHDLLITVGLYAAIGWEVTPSTVIGFLTILGYSLYDKVVVFDKVRENTVGVTDQLRSTYAERANLAVNQTLVRSINTSVVALLPVAAILFVGAFLLGAGTLRDISLALFVGIAVGTYSSIFLATPLEVALREREPAIKAHTAKVAARREEAAESGEPVVEDAGSLQLVPGSHQGNRSQPRRKR
ncbi:protein translocase subunit SecF [Luteimicrobium subarcticum]|uniref:Protein-export membrane protein SecF n=1 Tax=Luteimicrobium subarcticum TaxID=620910 RepID=A0A2M8W3Z6_9MICO|nr:protein translocase subunit SecF [Luteimicrobium subarcticum]PJI85646.1 protein translocase subunit secF [Luteimicrobium subarcticum]